MSWPTGVASDAELFVAANNFQTTLNGAIDAVTTTVVLTSVVGLPTSGGYVTIGTEAIKYTGIAVNTLTGVTRGADSTTAAAHSNGAAVFGFIVANHHNVLKEEIKAVETSLDLTASRAVVTSASGRVAVSATTAAELGALNAKTASRAVVTDGSGLISTAAVTATEIGHVSGVTSAIQTQINAKAPIASPTFSGTITTPLTASRAVVTGASNELSAAATTATEIGYVNGVTSAIQTQLNAKAATSALKVLQVVSATSTTEATTTSGTYGNTNLSASITPASTSNKILIIASSMIRIDGTGATGNVTLARGGSNILAAGGGAELRLEAGTGPLHVPCAITFLDSPSSTSALTYTTQIKTSGSTMRFGTTGTQSMILVEIAG